MGDAKDIQPGLPFDICANYHHGDQFSKAANLRTDKHGDIARILAFMRANDHVWVKLLIRSLGMKHQTASARLTDLKALHRIEPVILENGKHMKQENCGVWRLAK